MAPFPWDDLNETLFLVICCGDAAEDDNFYLEVPSELYLMPHGKERFSDDKSRQLLKFTESNNFTRDGAKLPIICKHSHSIRRDLSAAGDGTSMQT